MRLVRETERLFEYLEEEENKKKRTKVSEESGESKPSASSSGPVAAKETVPRSRGGVPMATDSGDSVQETVKRKAEDGGRQVGEELKDQEKDMERRGERSKEECGRVGRIRQETEDQR